MLSKEAVKQVEEALSTGESLNTIAKRLGVGRATVQTIAKGKHPCQQLGHVEASELHRQLAAILDTTDRPDPPNAFLPSAERIASYCRRFRRVSPRLPVGCSEVEAVEVVRAVVVC